MFAMRKLNRRYLDAAFVFLLAAAAHLPAVFRAEFTGEDELLFNGVSRSFLATLLGAPEVWKNIFRFYYPPMQWALPAPLIGLFGTSEWTLRLPGALCGIAAAVLLYLTMERWGGDRRSARLAAILAAAGGVASNHHYALTCGVFSIGAAYGALGLIRFVEAADRRMEERALLICAVGMVWAMMSLPDGFFYLPVLVLAYLVKRGFRFTPGAWGALALISLWVISYGVFWLLLPNRWGGGLAGGSLKVQSILSKFGTLRIGELTLSFAAGSSWLVTAASVLLLPIGYWTASRGLRWVAMFYAFPLGLWTFVFGYQNVRPAHMLLAFPGFALLWALGACKLFDWLRARSAWMGRLAALGLTLCVLSALWQTGVLHIADVVPESRMGPAWLVLRGYYPQARRVEVFGQHAAGWWIRNNSAAQDGVCCNLGGSFSDYYAARPAFPTESLPAYAQDPQAARRDGVRFYAHALNANGAREATLGDLPVALVVRHRGRTVMRVYDLWREGRATDELDAREGRRLFGQLR